MPLEAVINEWNPALIREAENVMVRAVISYQNSYGRSFPSTGVVSGNNWVYMGKIEPVNCRNTPIKIGGREGTSLGSLSFSIRMTGLKRAPGYVSLRETIEDYIINEIAEDEFALMPFGKRRQDEAKTLGSAIRKTESWFDIQYGGKTIKIFTSTHDEIFEVRP